MQTIDTNHILRWFLGDVPEQSTRAEQLLQNSEADTISLDRVHVAEVPTCYAARGTITAK